VQQQETAKERYLIDIVMLCPPLPGEVSDITISAMKSERPLCFIGKKRLNEGIMWKVEQLVITVIL
jgi:hypothetical protein